MSKLKLYHPFKVLNEMMYTYLPGSPNPRCVLCSKFLATTGNQHFQVYELLAAYSLLWFLKPTRIFCSDKTRFAERVDTVTSKFPCVQERLLLVKERKLYWI